MRSHEEKAMAQALGDGLRTSLSRRFVRGLPEELREGDQRLDQHGEEDDGGEGASGGDFTLAFTEQGQGGNRDHGVNQLTDDDAGGDTGVESSQVLELSLTDDLEALEEETFPTANLDQGHTFHNLLDHLHAFVTEAGEHMSGGAEEEWNSEDEEKEGADQHSNTGPDGDTENKV